MIEMDQDSGATQILSVSTFYRLVRLFVEKVLLYFREYFYAILHRHGDEDKINPRSVNYHFTRKCNYKCAFCFHTSKTSFVMPADEAKRGLKMLKDAGMEKINFSGGEPFVHSKGKYLGELMMYCKTVLRLDSVSVVSNGSLISEDWMAKYAEYLDVLAISCDSFDAGTNDAIGRFQNERTDHIGQLRRIRDWCLKYDVMFKINTVVNTANLDEDMSDHILRLQPARWKVFQCLLIDGENVGSNALRQAEKFYVSDDEFETFVRCHSRVPTLVVEDNRHMRDSYLILDEYMRFLNCRNNKKEPSKSILDVGVADALKCSGFDEQAFLERGGVYTWSKSKSAPAPALADDKLDW